MRLSAMIPCPTHLLIPSAPWERQRANPYRRLTTLIRPSHPVRHFWPRLNQRCFSSWRRSALRVPRLGPKRTSRPEHARLPRWRASNNQHPPPPIAACAPTCADAPPPPAEQVPVTGPLLIDLVMRDDLVLPLPATAPACRTRWVCLPFPCG